MAIVDPEAAFFCGRGELTSAGPIFGASRGYLPPRICQAADFSGCREVSPPAAS